MLRYSATPSTPTNRLTSFSSVVGRQKFEKHQKKESVMLCCLHNGFCIQTRIQTQHIQKKKTTHVARILKRQPSEGKLCAFRLTGKNICVWFDESVLYGCCCFCCSYCLRLFAMKTGKPVEKSPLFGDDYWGKVNDDAFKSQTI